MNELKPQMTLELLHTSGGLGVQNYTPTEQDTGSKTYRNREHKSIFTNSNSKSSSS